MSAAASARAHANIALVKYWGKRDAELNLPAAGSLSLTLGALTTTARVRFASELEEDSLVLDGAPVRGPSLQRLSGWLDRVRERAGLSDRAAVESDNDFPTASGLASSASAYAALALAATRAAGLSLDDRELSVLARLGSGSAARSIHGGFVLMRAGERADGGDAFATPLEAPADWPLRMVIAVVGGGKPKRVSSRDGMEHCAQTSPLYGAWLETVARDIEAARAAIAAADLPALGAIAEGSAMAMHAAAMASRPAVLYFQPGTLRCIETVRKLRGANVPAFFTIDAGPHVKVLTVAEHAVRVAEELDRVEGVSRTIVSAVGPAARPVE